MHINRTTFFAYARKAPFGNRLTAQQVEGMEAILDVWERDYSAKPLTWLAYILATVFHETGGLMVPVREGFAKTDTAARKIVAKRKYGKVGKYGFVPYGRGRVQLTWDRNYKKMEDRFGHPFTKNPDLMLQSDIDAEVTVTGHIEGLWTGKSLGLFFSGKKEDPVGARTIVNGTDKAHLIAGYYEAFKGALQAADEAVPQPKDVKACDALPDGADLTTDKTTLGAISGVIAGGGAGFLGGIDSPWAFAAVALVVVCVILFLTGRLEIKKKAGA